MDYKLHTYFWFDKAESLFRFSTSSAQIEQHFSSLASLCASRRAALVCSRAHSSLVVSACNAKRSRCTERNLLRCARSSLRAFVIGSSHCMLFWWRDMLLQFSNFCERVIIITWRGAKNIRKRTHPGLSVQTLVIHGDCCLLRSFRTSVQSFGAPNTV